MSEEQTTFTIPASIAAYVNSAIVQLLENAGDPCKAGILIERTMLEEIEVAALRDLSTTLTRQAQMLLASETRTQEIQQKISNFSHEGALTEGQIRVVALAMNQHPSVITVRDGRTWREIPAKNRRSAKWLAEHGLLEIHRDGDLCRLTEPVGVAVGEYWRKLILSRGVPSSPGPDVWKHRDGSEHSAKGPFGCLRCANMRREGPGRV